MSILQQVPAKMQAILETVADEVAVTTGLVKRKTKTYGECADANPRLRVVGKSRGELSATH